MTAEIPVEESSKMESTVAEISWNNLDSSFSNGDDLAAFGSFSDFLTLSNGGIDEQQQSVVAEVAAPINQALEQPVVSRGQELEAPVDQPVDLQVTSADQVKFGPVGGSPASANQVEFGSVGASLATASQVEFGSVGGSLPTANQVEFGSVGGSLAKANQVEFGSVGGSLATAYQSGFGSVATADQGGFGSVGGTAYQGGFGSVGGSFATANQVESGAVVAAVDPVVEQNHVQAVSDYYPGWRYNYQTGQWERTDEGQVDQWQQAYGNQLMAEQGTVKQLAQSNQGVVTQIGYEHNQLAQVNQGLASYTQDPYEGWTYNYQTNQWEEKRLKGQGYDMNHYVESKPQSTAESHYQGWSANYQAGQWEQVSQAPASAPVRQSVVTPPRTTEEALRSTAGRPPHAVTAFGFGGRLVVMKPKDPFLALEQSQSPVQIFPLNTLLAELNIGYGSTSVPLAGNASTKDVLKWIDEKSSKCLEDPSLDSLRYLWGILKISCQNYGNLRSTVTGPSKDDNGPEAALGKLLEPVQSYKASSSCLHPVPSERQLEATAVEVKRLLIAGKQQEALQAARNGQLWGPALLLAGQLGEKYYSETLAEMALRQFQPGFPLRTLSLLCAGQQKEVFEGVDSAKQNAVEGMIEEWQENLAIMAANPTNGDERVITYLGDCLWNYRNEVSGAHLCYLVANTAFEPFSDSARICLIGVDHKKFPRTYASPEAIQRTEVFEFAKVTGNSQFILLSFQPYKLIYAAMLAEAGKISEAQRYCQAVLKTLKSAGHAADFCKEAAVALDERLRFHSQGGPTSLVHRFFGNIGLHKMIPTTSKGRDNADNNNNRPATASSRSSSMLVPSASMEPISDTPVKSNVPVRSISEPDFSRSPQIDSPKSTPNKNVFSTIVQKAIGLIRTPSKEAKLGDTNKFRYDENLKCWVEEGAEAPVQAPTFAPPPITKRIQHEEPYKPREESRKPPEENNGFYTSSPVKPQQTHAVSGIPPMPPSSNHYSARARQNVRSRYVDTFNKGGAGGATTAPSKPSSSSMLLPQVRHGSMPPAKFFVPAPQDATSSVGAAEVSSQMAVSNGPAAVASVEQVSGHESNGVPPWAETPAMNHQPTDAAALPVPPVLQAQPPILPDGSSKKEASVPLIHTEKTPFGEDMQEVEL